MAGRRIAKTGVGAIPPVPPAELVQPSGESSLDAPGFNVASSAATRPVFSALPNLPLFAPDLAAYFASMRFARSSVPVALPVLSGAAMPLPLHLSHAWQQLQSRMQEIQAEGGRVPEAIRPHWDFLANARIELSTDQELAVVQIAIERDRNVLHIHAAFFADLAAVD